LARRRVAVYHGAAPQAVALLFLRQSPRAGELFMRGISSLLLAGGLLIAVPLSVHAAGQIRTIGGNGRQTFSGDGTPALEAGIGGPFGLAIGPDGALYVCSTTNHCIRRIDDKTGFISTVAGCGKLGYDGDGKPADRALCNEPYEVRFDSDGNFFFVEMQNHIVRKVDAKTKLISTVAGTGQPGFSGDGGKAVKARLKQPHSIALDGAGGLYIADIGNHRVRRVDLASGVIETIAGTGDKGPVPDNAPLEGTPLSGPRAIDFDLRGRMFLALREGNAVLRVDLRGQKLLHYAGTGRSGNSGDGGPALRATFNGPKGIAVGPGGDIYLADTENHVIRVIRAKDGNIETLIGDGSPGDGSEDDPRRCRLRQPHGVCVDALGNVYVGDSSNNKVRKLEVK
jgi:DNA-binding beta-propeller fold protein YncE